MKMKLLILLLSVLIFTMCNNKGEGHEEQISTDVINNPFSAEGNNDVSGLPVFSVKEKLHDFGVIIQGEKVSHTFKYINTGKSELIVSSVKASCGCTVPKYDKEPIGPGEEGQIEVIFDSGGRKGQQHKTITVLANSQPNKIELGFTAEIIVPENE